MIRYRLSEKLSRDAYDEWLRRLSEGDPVMIQGPHDFRAEHLFRGVVVKEVLTLGSTYRYLIRLDPGSGYDIKSLRVDKYGKSYSPSYGGFFEIYPVEV